MLFVRMGYIITMLYWLPPNSSDVFEIVIRIQVNVWISKGKFLLMLYSCMVMLQSKEERDRDRVVEERLI